MSAGSLLLRVVLMLSLLLNGLNVAMAGPMALAMAAPVAAAPAPPCHGDAPVPTRHHDHAASVADGTAAQAPHDGEHCKIKDCLRNCAQQPSLTAAISWIPSPPPLSPAPTSPTRPSLPTPPLDRITRPPIG
ncbi:MAG: CopL family metal-binding regulatory protein [Stenotrophomonas sp.]